MAFRPTTKRGYSLFDCASALQKAIRRNDAIMAGYFGLELFSSGYHAYVWRRLLTISAEDCYGIITKEIKALYDSNQVVLKAQKKQSKRGQTRVFVSKAIILLCQSGKNRDADNLTNIIYEMKVGITDKEIDKFMKGAETEKLLDLPEYTYDCHTSKGKKRGKSKVDFLKDEEKALTPKQPGLFDNLPEKL